VKHRDRTAFYRLSPWSGLDPPSWTSDHADMSLLLVVANVVAAGQLFSCTPTRLWDGDGPIWCAEGPRVRLSAIAAREADGTCRSNQPCPSATADQARTALAALLGRVTGQAAEGHLLIAGPTLRCVSEGSAGGSRTAAWCTSPGRGDLSCAMVRTRTVLRWPRFDPQGRLRACE